MRDLIMFDMDGVLVEVTESYRESIRQTVEHFTSKQVTFDMIQVYKNAGGWNNDWKLSQRMAADLGVEVDYQTVIDYFQSVFLGPDGNGLIRREKWIARDGALESLSTRCDLGVYTGRPRYEAMLTIDRWATNLRFEPILTADDVTKGKPDPEGLHIVQRAHPGRQLWYVGDTIDDARCARRANVPFIGVASQSHGRRAELLDLFAQENAATVLEDINQLESFLANR